METLASLATILSADLSKMSGQKVKSALEAYRTMQEMIPHSRFHQILTDLEMDEMIYMSDSVSELRYVFLRTSPTDENPQKIMSLDAAIEYFDENSIDAGGTVSSWSCNIIGDGVKVKDVPLPKIILQLRVTDEEEKEKKQQERIEKLEAELDKAKKEHKMTLEVIDNLKSRMREI